jgi:RNA polymerase sigma factor (sigma-70 family)
VDTADYSTLLAAIRRLPPKQRAVIALRYFLDLSEPATAEALGCAVGTVKTHTSRALTKLRSTIVIDTAGDLMLQEDS